MASQADPSPFSAPDATLVRSILTVLHYASPIVLLCFLLAALACRSFLASSLSSRNSNRNPLVISTGPGGKPLPTGALSHATTTAAYPTFDDLVQPARRPVFQWLSLLVALSFVGDASLVLTHALYDRAGGWWCGKPTVIYIMGSMFVYLFFSLSLIDMAPGPTFAHQLSWILALALELAFFACSFVKYSPRHRYAMLGHCSGRLCFGMTDWERAELTLHLARTVMLCALVALYSAFVTRAQRSNAQDAHSTDETVALLGSDREADEGYGTAEEDEGKRTEGEREPGWVRPAHAPPRTWWDYIRGYSLFFPYLWPSKDRKLQIVLAICFVLVVVQRIINLMVPALIGTITDKLSRSAKTDSQIKVPWADICFFVVLRSIQGSNGVLTVLRSSLWVQISQYSYRELAVAAFEHVHNLSLDFHLGKKTGEVISALGKGGSINAFLEHLTFSVVPMIVDLCIAIGYFLIKFDAYYALVISVVAFWYVYFTIRLAQRRAVARRDMANAERREDAVKNDSMMSYETVKYFNAEDFEFDRYRDAVDTYQQAEYMSTSSLNTMTVVQNVVFMAGLLIACFIVAYQVTTGQRDVGQFMTLVTYMGQLQAPLSSFGAFYRVVQSSMINSERLLELFKERPTVVDKDGAAPVSACQGDIRFTGVHFAYDHRRPALQGVDFHCKPGTTTAFVGESGGGKSTMFRLLFRFYNPVSGTIEIDGRDVNHLTIESVRHSMGVVPQDTILFNETLMYNLRYANPGATDEDVYKACRAASIHERIMSFPEKYHTRVGERGLRLSGGEKQRVAIARTILKDPRIILLDEATAALDSDTEQRIQEALLTLSQGRTMLIIAHRLSTITHADQILVLNKGCVVERGTHEELLVRDGQYATMWRRQIQAERSAEHSNALRARAVQLRRRAQRNPSCELGSNAPQSSMLNHEDNVRRRRPSWRNNRGEDDDWTGSSRAK